MPSSLPSPVAAAIGIVPAVLDGVRHLPGRAVKLPVLAVSSALNGMEALRKEYDDLADRGERLVARLRGEAVDRADALEERLGSVVGSTGPGSLGRVGDAAVTALRPPASFAVAAGDAAEQVVADVAPLVAGACKATGRAVGKVADTADQAAGKVAATADRAAGKVADTADEAAGKVAATADRAAGKVAATADEAAGKASKAAGKVADTADRAAATADKAAGKAAATADTAADEVADAVTSTVETAAATVADVTERAAETAAAPAAPEAAAPPAAEAPKGGPTPTGVEPGGGRVDTAATPAVVEVVTQAVAAVSAVVLGHDDLPLADYDHMTLGSLRGRLRSLSVDQLVQVRTYEKAHADRLPVVTMLDNRIAKLATEAAGRPEPGVAAAGPTGPVSPAATGSATAGSR